MNRVAIVHDFFVQDGGAEKCAIELATMYPEADVYTTFFDAARFGDRIDPDRVHTWPVQRLLGPTPRFRSLLPLYPLWYSTLDLRRYDLVIASSIAFTHASRTSRPPEGRFVAYVYTPMRYAWDLDRYLAGSSQGRIARVGGQALKAPLRRWDRWAARRPDTLIAISEAVQARIKKRWGRDSTVVYPLVPIDEIGLGERDDGFLLVASRLLAYRRIDLAVEAATKLNRELVIVGDGPEMARLRGLAGSSVRFEGHVDRARLVELMRTCHAYVVPGEEDFGIAPVEAMAAGKPVVAFGAGGALETVVEGETGVFFRKPQVDALIDAIRTLDEGTFDPAVARRQAEQFSPEAFREGIRRAVERS